MIILTIVLPCTKAPVRAKGILKERLKLKGMSYLLFPRCILHLDMFRLKVS